MRRGRRRKKSRSAALSGIPQPEANFYKLKRGKRKGEGSRPVRIRPPFREKRGERRGDAGVSKSLSTSISKRKKKRREGAADG